MHDGVHAARTDEQALPGCASWRSIASHLAPVFTMLLFFSLLKSIAQTRLQSAGRAPSALPKHSRR
jgi:hypothetical protein